MLRVFAIIYAPPGKFPHWGKQPLVIWTAIETNVAIICSCLPTLRIPATRLLRKIRVGKRLRSNLSSWSSKSKASDCGSTDSGEKESDKDTNITVRTDIMSYSSDESGLKSEHDEKRPNTLTYFIASSSPKQQSDLIDHV